MSVHQSESLGVCDNIDTYHTHVGMDAFPQPVLHSTMRKVSEESAVSVSSYFPPISSMLDLGIGVGNYGQTGTPAATAGMGVGAFGSISNGFTVRLCPLRLRQLVLLHRV